MLTSLQHQRSPCSELAPYGAKEVLWNNNKINGSNFW
jgi:hypothetical protein